jgi:hypothetical protein
MHLMVGVVRRSVETEEAFALVVQNSLLPTTHKKVEGLGCHAGVQTIVWICICPVCQGCPYQFTVMTDWALPGIIVI